MSTIVPPLNIIPELPVKSVTKLIEILNKQLGKLNDNIQKMIADVIKLPEGCNCNDPRIKAIKEQLINIQKSINNIKLLLANLNKIIQSLTKLINLAKGVKLAVSAAALLNPLTAPAFIATQLTLIQDATIVNAVNSLMVLKQIPMTINSNLASLLPPVLDALSKISSTCGGNSDVTLSIPKGVRDAINDSDTISDSVKASINSKNINNNLLVQDDNDDFDYNDLLNTEFYTDDNVSDGDLSDRAEAIKRMVERQQDLLTSITEAPSQVFSGNGAPASSLGKIGDYYVNKQSNEIFGPKMSNTSWT